MLAILCSGILVMSARYAALDLLILIDSIKAAAAF